ncbi:MAG: U32 family peptidase [Clostridia bacterium]|nr:U32 family peptidase [Clostridia bacterium]
MPMELMSPAGSPEGIIAAVRGGADAVYFGTDDFNARRNAKNLSGEDLIDAMRYCRLRGVKTYVTVNTLVTDRELLRARELILRLNELGADALIVQDLGMARMIRALAPEMPIHASTQMTVHNIGGVLAAHKLGFSRVVLSRELPLREIAFICKHSPIEIEVFVHGALCMCYSGQCYLSAAIGGRSGNRGLCAQPCRMAYSFFGESPGHPLSLKDLSLAQHLRELEEAGVHTLKIEGRMKRPEYTALVTHVYKRAITEGRAPSAEEMAQLQAVFSRDGFTDGYFTGKKGSAMFGTRSEDNGREARALYKQAQELYLPEPETPTVPVKMRFTAKAGQEMRLVAEDRDGFFYECRGTPAEPAIRRATTAEEIRSALMKTGGTVFLPDEPEITLDEGLRASAAAVNAMRRQCLEGLAVARRQPPKRAVGEWQPGMRRLRREDAPGWIFSFLSADQLTGTILRAGAEMIWLPLPEIAARLPLIETLAGQGIRFAAVMDRIIFDSEWDRVLRQLREIRAAGVADLAVTNLGQIPVVQKLGFTLHGDFGLNVMNSQSAKELRQLGLSSCTLSFEMNLAQIRDLNLGMDGQIIAYGRLPLMITENCVTKRHGDGCARDGRSCGRNNAIIDKTGRSFPIRRETGCRSTVYNAEKLWLADKTAELRELGLRWLRLSFTTENSKEIEAVINAYREGEGAMPERATRGLYYRGVQ